MIGMRMAQAQRLFFDSPRVAAATTAAERRVLSRFGAFVRQRARTSIRPGAGSSPPGDPPRSHTGLLRRGILFAYDPIHRSVVIGPVLLGGHTGEAQDLLEHGGTAVRVQRRQRRRVVYRPRPFMAPAFAAELPTLPPLWRDSVR